MLTLSRKSEKYIVHGSLATRVNDAAGLEQLSVTVSFGSISGGQGALCAPVICDAGKLSSRMQMTG